MNRALAIDPLSRMLTEDLSMIQWKQRRYDVALKGLDRVHDLDPDYLWLDVSRGVIYESQKDWTRAEAAFQRARQRMQDAPPAVALAAQAAALAGDTAAARRDLAALREAARKMYVADYIVGIVEFALGDKEQGRASLKKSIDAHCGLLLWMKTAPVFDQIAGDVKGAELIREIGGPI